MDEPKKSFLSNLIALNKVDTALGRIVLERKRIANEKEQRTAKLRESDFETQKKVRIFEEKKTKYNKEERSLRDEQVKLVDRRKALTTLSSYKLQQAAEREVENSSKQLGEREEALLVVLEEVEALEKQAQTALDSITQQKTELEKFEAESNDLLAGYAEREKERLLERKELATQVDSAMLKIYDRIRERYPLDALMAVKNQTCTACHMQVGPQVFVSLSRGDVVVKCPGCGRILFLDEEHSGK